MYEKCEESPSQDERSRPSESQSAKKRKKFGTVREVMKKLHVSTFETGPDCESKTHQCFRKIPPQQRSILIKKLNALGDWNKQSAHLAGLMNIVPIKQRYAKGDEEEANFRDCSFHYKIIMEQNDGYQEEVVCRQGFIISLPYGRSFLRARFCSAQLAAGWYILVGRPLLLVRINFGLPGPCSASMSDSVPMIQHHCSYNLSVGPSRRISPPLYTQLTKLANTIPTSCVTILKRTPNMLVLGELVRANKLCWVVLDHLLEIINDQPNMLAESGGTAHVQKESERDNSVTSMDRRGQSEKRTQDRTNGIILKLSDKENKKEIIFKAKDLYREHFPKECTTIGNIKIDKSKIPELASANTIYFVNDIIGAREIELHIKVDQNSQEYLFTSQPLVFGYEKYLLNKDACIIRKMTNAVSSKRTSWTAVK
uniref:Uncharacterized protein n=1 Tax=Timema monikensis TaxID=170555 RepID=A0A7R9EHK2_9NEOP|nr:unnamed protein product [Timema monikensis]